MCRYKRFCKFPGPGCTAEYENICPKAQSLSKTICPLMAATNTAAANCGCDIQAIRNLWPAGKPCFEGNECLPRRFKTVQAQIGKVIDAKSILTSFASA